MYNPRRQNIFQSPNTYGLLWWKNAVFYEAYVDRFAGTFTGFIHKLDYLKLLGIDCIHLLPHYPSPMIDDGYDVSNYTDVRKELGTLKDFSAFVEAAHFAVQANEQIRKFFQRKAAKKNKIVAIKAVAHKLSRACYHVMKNQTAFDVTKAFA